MPLICVRICQVWLNVRGGNTVLPVHSRGAVNDPEWQLIDSGNVYGSSEWQAMGHDQVTNSKSLDLSVMSIIRN